MPSIADDAVVPSGVMRNRCRMWIRGILLLAVSCMAGWAVDNPPTITVPATAASSSVTGTTVGLTVAATDDGGAGNLTYTWSMYSGPAVPVVSVGFAPANSPTTTATFMRSGNYTLQVVITDQAQNSVTSRVSVSVVAVSTSVAVTPSAVTLSQGGSQTFSARVVDQFGLPVPLLPPPTMVWSVSPVGTITTTGILTVTQQGTGSVTATAMGLSGTASVIVTAPTQTPTVAVPASASPNPAAGTTTTLSVLGADDGGEGNLRYTWSLAGGQPGGAVFQNQGSTAVLSVYHTGTYNLLATITDAGGLSVTSPVSVRFDPTPTTLMLNPSPSVINITQTWQYTASLYDQFGQVMTPPAPIAWSITGGGVITTSGLFTAGSTGGGPYQVTAAVAGLSGSGSFSVNATPVTPTIITPATATPSSVTGTTTALSVLGGDIGGESVLTYTWSAINPPAPVVFSSNGSNAAKQTIATFAAAGTYALQVTITDPLWPRSTTAFVNVNVISRMVSLSMSPASANVVIGQSSKFTATAVDQFGASPAFLMLWSVTGGGLIDATGRFTAGQTVGGPYQVTAAFPPGGLSATAAVTVVNAVPTVATAAAASPNPVTGTTTTLSVLGADDGGEANLTYTWSTTGTPPAPVVFSANGTNAAKSSIATFTKPGLYNLQATIADAGSLTVASPVVVTVTPTLTTITLSPGPVTLPAGQPQTFTAVAKDQFGTALSSQPTYTWTATGSPSGSGTPTMTWSTVGGPYAATATAGGISGTSTVTVVANVAPTVAAAAAATPNPVTGTTATLSVLGADDNGEPSLTYIWATTGTPPAAVTFGTNTSNSAKSTVATFTKAGTYALQATIQDKSGLTVISAVTITVNATLTSIVVSPGPVTLPAGQPQAFTAVAKDQFGTALSSQPAYTWSATGSPSGSGTPTMTWSTVGGPYAATATAGGISGTATVTVVANAAPTVATGASATPSPVTGTTATLSALGADDNGEPNLTYTWSTTGTPPAAVTYSLNGSNAAKTSVATFAKAGTYAFQVTIADKSNLTVTGAVTVTVNATLTSIVPAPAVVTLPTSQPQTFTATAKDQFGTALSPQPTITWSATGSPTGSGTATMSWATAGGYTVTASSGGKSGTSTVTVNANTAPTVATAAVATPSPTSGKTATLSVLGADDGGEANLIYTWATTGTPPAAVAISPNGTNAAKSAVVTFTKVGVYSLQATIKDKGGMSVTSPVTVTVSPAATSINLSPTTVTLPAGQPQTFSASVKDQFGTSLSPQPTITWTATGGGTIAGAVITWATAGGPYTATVTAGGLSQSATVTVVPNVAPTVATAAVATPSPVTGTSTNLTALGADDNGEANLIYTWSTTGTPPGSVTFTPNKTNAAKSTVATFGRAGAYNFQVTIADKSGLTATSAVAVTVQAVPTTLVVMPATATLPAGQPQTFMPSAKDQFGVALSPQPTITWATTGGGTVVGNVITWATPGGPYTATATDGSLSGSATVTVVPNAAPTVATVAVATPSSVIGKTTTLSVLGADDNGEASLTYSWATTGTPPASVGFSPNGTNASKSTTATFTRAGTYALQVTIKDKSGLTTTSPVTVTVNQTQTSISVTPATATVVVGLARTFSAVAKDQFGVAMLTPPVFAWAVAGGGSITSGGVFTAGLTTGGPYAITASANAQVGTASVTVVNVAPTIATAAGASPTTVTGKTSNLAVLGADDGGESNLIYTWATTGTPPAAVVFTPNATNAAKAAVATFAKAGSYTVQVTVSDRGGQAITSAVSITVNQTQTAVVVAPGTANAVIGSAVSYTALATDQFGNAMAGQPPFTWSVTGGGVISSAGVFTAGLVTGGPFTVKAVGGSQTGSATVTVVNAAPSVATAAAASPNPVTGKTAALSVLGSDDGGEPSLVYTWSATGTPPAPVVFSINGTNGAKTTTATFAKAGAYPLQVVIADRGNVTTTSSLTVQVNQTASAIMVSPSSAAVVIGTSQQFTASVSDQFGIMLAPQPSCQWAVSGGGTVNTVGTFTAGSTIGGPYTLSATVGSATGSASITLVLPTVATPTVSPGNRAVVIGPAVFKASTLTSGTSITYTTDGTTPTASSTPVPSSGLNLTQDATVTVRAFKSGYNPSAVVAASLTILPAVGFPTTDPLAATPGVAVNLPVSLSTTAGHDVRVTYRVEGDLTHVTNPLAGTLLIPAGASNGSIPLTITDNGVAGDASYAVVLTDAGGAVLTAATQRLIKVTSTAPTPSVAMAVPTVSMIEGTTITVPFSLSSGSAEVVQPTVTVTPVGQTTRTMTVNFSQTYAAPGSPQGQISLTVPNDGVVTPSDTFTVALQPGAGYQIGAAGSVTVTVKEGYTGSYPVLAVTPSAVTIASGAAVHLTVNQWSSPTASAVVAPAAVTWSVPAGASVDAYGNLTVQNLLMGSFTAIASAGGITASCQVTLDGMLPQPTFALQGWQQPKVTLGAGDPTIRMGYISTDFRVSYQVTKVTMSAQNAGVNLLLYTRPSTATGLGISTSWTATIPTDSVVDGLYTVYFDGTATVGSTVQPFHVAATTPVLVDVTPPAINARVPDSDIAIINNNTLSGIGGNDELSRWDFHGVSTSNPATATIVDIGSGINPATATGCVVLDISTDGTTAHVKKTSRYGTVSDNAGNMLTIWLDPSPVYGYQTANVVPAVLTTSGCMAKADQYGGTYKYRDNWLNYFISAGDVARAWVDTIDGAHELVQLGGDNNAWGLQAPISINLHDNVTAQPLVLHWVDSQGNYSGPRSISLLRDPSIFNAQILTDNAGKVWEIDVYPAGDQPDTVEPIELEGSPLMHTRLAKINWQVEDLNYKPRGTSGSYLAEVTIPAPTSVALAAQMSPYYYPSYYGWTANNTSVNGTAVAQSIMAGTWQPKYNTPGYPGLGGTITSTWRMPSWRDRMLPANQTYTIIPQQFVQAASVSSYPYQTMPMRYMSGYGLNGKTDVYLTPAYPGWYDTVFLWQSYGERQNSSIPSQYVQPGYVDLQQIMSGTVVMNTTETSLHLFGYRAANIVTAPTIKVCGGRTGTLIVSGGFFSSSGAIVDESAIPSCVEFVASDGTVVPNQGDAGITVLSAQYSGYPFSRCLNLNLTVQVGASLSPGLYSLGIRVGDVQAVAGITPAAQTLPGGYFKIADCVDVFQSYIHVITREPDGTIDVDAPLENDTPVLGIAASLSASVSSDGMTVTISGNGNILDSLSASLGDISADAIILKVNGNQVASIPFSVTAGDGTWYKRDPRPAFNFTTSVPIQPRLDIDVVASNAAGGKASSTWQITSQDMAVAPLSSGQFGDVKFLTLDPGASLVLSIGGQQITAAFAAAGYMFTYGGDAYQLTLAAGIAPGDVVVCMDQTSGTSHSGSIDAYMKSAALIPLPNPSVTTTPQMALVLQKISEDAGSEASMHMLKVKYVSRTVIGTPANTTLRAGSGSFTTTGN